MPPSQNILSTNNEPMLSARDAAARLKCVPGYIGKLCREGKLQGEQLGGQWLVVAASIDAFEAVRAEAKDVRAAQLAQQRHDEHASYRTLHAPFVERLIFPARKLFGGARIGMGFGAALLFGALVFASGLHLPEHEHAASVAAVSEAQSPFFGMQPPSVTLATNAGQSFAGATNFLSNVFSLLFGNSNKVASNVATEPSLNLPIGAGAPRESFAPAFATASTSPQNSSAVSQNRSGSSAQASPQIVNNYPVIERIVERNVATGGVTPDELNTRLQGLYNKLAVQISTLQNPGHESPYQNVVISEKINNLSDVRLSGNTTANNINADYINLGELHVTGNTNLAGTLVAATTTLSTLSVNGNTTIGGNLTLGGSGSTQGNFNAGTSTVTNLIVSNLSTSTFAGPLAVGGSASTTGSAYIGGNLQVAGNATSTSFFATNASSTNFATHIGQIDLLTVSATAQFTNLGTFRLGMLSLGSTTIGSGFQTTGLTINGGATTTGDAYVAGGLGVGIATSAPGTLQVANNAYFGGNLFVGGNSVTLGASSANTLSVNSSITSNLVPDQNVVHDIGSPSFYWRNVYVGNINANNISAASTTIAGTASQTFTINSANATADTQDASLIFFRGTVVPNALLTWASSPKRFEFNQSLFIQNASTNQLANTTLDLKGQAGQTGALFNVASSTGTSYFNINNLGLATLAQGFVSQASSTVGGSFTTTGNQTIGGTLAVSGLSTLSNGFLSTASSTVNGPLNVTGATNLNSPLNVLGNTTLANATSTAFFASSASSTNLFAQNATLGVLAAQSLSVSGLATLSSGFLATASSTVNGSFTATGAAMLGSTLNVSGLATLGSGFVSQASSTVAGNFTVAGAATLGSTLSVSGLSTLSAGFLSLASSTVNGGLFTANGGASTTVLSATGSSYFATNGGLVGIGTTSPSQLLSVAGNGYFSGSLGIGTNAPGSSLAVTGAAASTYLRTTSSNNVVGGFGSDFTVANAVNIGSLSNNDVAFLTNNGERMRLTAAGNVGIGTTTPQQLLQLGTGAGVNTDRFIRFNNGLNPVGADIGVSAGGSGLFLLSRDAAPVNIGTNGTTGQLVVASGGNVAVGTTNPIAKFQVNVGTNMNLAVRANSDTELYSVNDTNSAYNALRLNASTLYLNAQSGGNVGIGAANARQKLEIGGPTPALAITDSSAGADGKTWDLFASGANLYGRVVNDAYSAAATWVQVTRSGATVSNVSFPNGNVGIGTTIPFTVLDVQTASGAPAASGNVNSGVVIAQTGGGGPSLNMGIVNPGTGSGYYSWIQSAFHNNAGVAEPLALNPNGGNVGVGTSSPFRTLSVAGDVGAKSVFIEGNGTYAPGAIYADVNWGMIFRAKTASPTNADFLWSNSADTHRMIIDPNGRLGVNVDTPGYRAEIKGSSGSGYFALTNSSSGDIFSVNSSGNVGIGMTPGKKLDVNGVIGFQTTLYGNGLAVAETGDAYLRINQANQFSNGIWLGTSPLRIDQGTFELGSQGGAGEVTISGTSGDATNRITINGNSGANSWFNTSGNVGIGTTSPTALLTVQGASSNTSGFMGNVSGCGANYWGITIDTGYSNNCAKYTLLGDSSGGTYLNSHTGQPIYFRIGNTDAMNLTSSGKLGIGTTPSTAGAIISIGNGANDPVNYGQALQITNASGNRQQIAFIRSGNNVVSAGYNGASSVWGFGAGNATDASFTPSWLSIDAATGNVGIGNTNPTQKFMVSGADSAAIAVIAGATKGIRLGASGIASSIEGVDQTGVASYQPLAVGGSQLLFTNSGVEYMRLTGGNLGIGTTSPAGKLGVAGDIYSNNLLLQGNNTDTYIRPTNANSSLVLGAGNTNYFFLNSAGAITNSNSITSTGTNGGVFVNDRSTSGTGGLYRTGGVTNLWDSTAGNVLSYTSSTGSVNLVNNLTFTLVNPSITTGGSYITIPNGLYVSGGTPYFQTQAQFRAGIHNDTAAYLQVDGGTSGYTYFTGNVGVGTTSPYGYLSVNPNGIGTSPAFVIGSSTRTLFAISNAGAMTYGGVTLSASVTGTGSMVLSSSPSFGGTASFVFGGFQGLYNAANNIDGYYACQRASVDGLIGYNVSCSQSDERLKENIQTLPDSRGLEAIRQLRAVEFDWKDERRNEMDGHQIGLIAQEVSPLYPELVGTTPGTTTITLSDGTKQEIANTRTLNYMNLTAPLVLAVQELDKEVQGQQVATTTMADLAASSTTSTFSGVLRAGVAELGQMVVRTFDGAIGATVGIFNKVYAGEIHTDQLCVGTVCVTQDQFLKMVNVSNAATSTPGVPSGGATDSASSTPADTLPPQITLLGADPAMLHIGDTYSDPGVTVSDAGSPNIGYVMSMDGGATTTPDLFQLDTSTSTTHLILYSATDQAGNVGTATRTVIVEN